MPRFRLPVRAQPDNGHGALPFRESVEHEWTEAEIDLVERLHSTARASEGEARTRAVNEIMVLSEIKEFFGDDAHLASLAEEDDRLPEWAAAFRAKEAKVRHDQPPPDHEQFSLLAQEHADTPLALPPDVRARMRGSDEPDLDRLPDFDGETYVRALDHARLGKQLLRVGREMANGQWHTLNSLHVATGDPEASISARLRDLRKHKFGGHTVERRRIGGGLFEYRMTLRAVEAWDEEEAE